MESRDILFLQQSLTDFPLMIWKWNLRDGTFMTSAGIANFLREKPSFQIRHLHKWIENAHPDDRHRIHEVVQSLREGRVERFSLLYRIRDESGQWRWVLSQGETSSRDAKGVPLEATGITVDQTSHMKDVNERQILQQQLAESEERLKLALEATQDGLWDWDLENDEVFISDHWVEMLGYTSEDIPPSAKVLFEIMHPEDKDRARALLHSHLRGETPSYEAEFRALTRDGEWKWILSRGRVVSRNSHGKPLRIVGTHTDISSRVRNQEQIQELEARLRDASSRDSLTGVLNRQAFRRILNREADRSLRYSSPLSLILINFDRFNLINSEYGHQGGDRLLVEASRFIGREIRTSDNLARWSGEEFIILTPEKLRGALTLAEKLRAGITSSSFSGLPPVSASFGVATYRNGEKVENFLQRVDIALYKAKKHQGNRVASQE